MSGISERQVSILSHSSASGQLLTHYDDESALTLVGVKENSVFG